MGDAVKSLNNLRISKGISQTELAEMINRYCEVKDLSFHTTQSTLSKLFNKVDCENVPIGTIKLLARVLEVDYKKLL
jgi:transcriptional regulator with XRE-family HTH domain